jgi:hypothetical protein
MAIGETSIAIAQESQPNVNAATQNNTTSIPLNSTEFILVLDVS